MSYNVNELDNRVEEYLSSGLQGAEEWRRYKASMPSRESMPKSRLVSLAKRAAGGTGSAAGQIAGTFGAWFAKANEPREECC
jgi:hypothetical protein